MIKYNSLKSAAIVALMVGSLNSAIASDKNHSLFIEAAMVDIDQEYGNDKSFTGSDKGVLPGLGYAYKIELAHQYFIKPGLVVNFSDIEIKDTDGTSDSSKFSSMHSIYADFGKKLNNNFSAYATLGFTKATLQRDEPSSSYSSSATDSGATIGLGFTYHVHKNIDLDLKYHTTDIAFRLKDDSTKFNTSIDALKLSAAYKF